MEVLDTYMYELKQHIDHPTHYLGNTLDLIVVKESWTFDFKLVSEVKNFVSDHAALNFMWNIVKPCYPVEQRAVRKFRCVDKTIFGQELKVNLREIDNTSELETLTTNQDHAYAYYYNNY